MQKKLVSALENESSALTPMLRSSTYTKVVEEGNNILPYLIASITDDSEKHYLSLMAISEISPSSLEKIPVQNRLKIYINALQKGGSHNDWGLAGRYLSGASLDIVNMGEQAIPFLTPLLDDTTEIGMWGSKEATINELYKNRVCDFVYYLILHILDRVEPYAETPAERDEAITDLKHYLNNNRLE